MVLVRDFRKEKPFLNIVSVMKILLIDNSWIFFLFSKRSYVGVAVFQIWHEAKEERALKKAL